MDKKINEPKPKLLARVANNYSGPITGVALSVLSAWMIIIGLKGLAGFQVNQTTALADLVGIIVVVGFARWVKTRSNAEK